MNNDYYNDNMFHDSNDTQALCTRRRRTRTRTRRLRRIKSGLCVLDAECSFNAGPAS